MKINTKTIGSFGESLAKDFLLQKNYKIITCNFRNRFGEIDIIAQKEDILVFVEVKTRYNYLYGLPCHSITYKKKKNIILLSTFFISKYNLLNYYIRFDVIEIFLNAERDSFKINHIKDAFQVQ